MMVFAPIASVGFFRADESGGATSYAITAGSQQGHNGDAPFNTGTISSALSPTVLAGLTMTVNTPGDAADVTAANQIDENRREADLDNVPAESPENRAALRAGLAKGVDDAAKIIASENFRE